MSMFNHDWFHGDGWKRQLDEAKRRCAKRHFESDAPALDGNGSNEWDQYLAELDTRTVIYLKDGLSYELKELAEIGTNSALAFECVPVDEAYEVGAYVIVVPFDDIVRVEVYAVHPNEKPIENLRIPGFRNSGEPAK